MRTGGVWGYLHEIGVWGSRSRIALCHCVRELRGAACPGVTVDPQYDVVFSATGTTRLRPLAPHVVAQRGTNGYPKRDFMDPDRPVHCTRRVTYHRWVTFVAAAAAAWLAMVGGVATQRQWQRQRSRWSSPVTA